MKLKQIQVLLDKRLRGKWNRFCTICHRVGKDQRIMAVLLTALGCANIEISALYQPAAYRMINAEIIPVAEWSEKNTVISTPSSAEMAEKESDEPVLSLDDMNLFYIFPDGATDNKPGSSVGGQIFEELTNWDVDWASAVYSFSHLTPTEMTEKMGISKACIIGDYNPADENHIADDPSTWIIDKFRNVWFLTEDGDGNSISPYSNIFQIMSLANVYSYYQDPYDQGAFMAYCKEIWKASHFYTLVISDIYHCQGCVREDGTVAEEMEIGTESNARLEFEDTGDDEEDGELFCPGHVDLTIVLKIAGLTEENNLFTLDTSGNDENSYTQDGWQGWNEENRQAVLRLAAKDWYLEYGLRTETASLQQPVSTVDVEAYLRDLPFELSEERRNLLRFALNSVGRVPYYWGGKPSAGGYEGNNFGTEVSPDTEGRSLKGLDCSGWISWVYWSATGKRLPYESTTGLASVGERISKEELRPGDILVRTGKDAHTVMFLGWTQDGKIQCVHETSGSVNNVTISIRDADWPYYIRLME